MKTHSWTSLSLISMTWMLASVSGHCFWNSGFHDTFPAAANAVPRYEHSSCGEVIRATGPMAKANPFRFSTKNQDNETDLLFYGYRYYNASTGRWLSRDPIGEVGGKNLYGFVENTPPCRIDAVGHSSCRKCGVKSVSLQIVGFIRDYQSYSFPLVGDVAFKTKKDGEQYDSTCCLTIQITRGTATWNGKRVERSNLGLPLDGSWYIDENPWLRLDQLETAARGVHFIQSRIDAVTGELIWGRAYDDPGVKSNLKEGNSINDEGDFQWLVYDMCEAQADSAKPYRRVAQSKIIHYRLSSSNWPEFDYSYTK